MNKEKYQALLEKYLNGDCSDEERALLDDWYASLDKKVIAKSEIERIDTEEEKKILEDKNWVALKSKIDEDVVTTRPQLAWRYWAAAASLLLIMSLGGYFYLKPKRVQESMASKATIEQTKKTNILEKNNTSNQAIRLELSDKSIVILKPNSTLRYAEVFGGNIREVTLVGEAFFEITKNPEKPFLVYTNDVVTKVLGTSFNIKGNKDTKNVIVDVRTGKVSVYSKKLIQSTPNSSMDSIGVILTPNQRVQYVSAKNHLIKSLVEKPVVLIPKEELKKFTFVDAPIDRVFAAIETAYGVNIVFDKNIMQDCTMTTSLEEENLYDKLTIICKLLGATFKTVDTQIVIKSTGCH